MNPWIKRQTIEGFLDMGKPQIPPLPTKIALTDRVSGIMYYLGTIGSYPTLTVDISAALVTDRVAGVRNYDAYFGPVVDKHYRLFVSNGLLDVELIDTDQSQTRIFARNGNSTQAVEVTAPGGVLTYTNVQL